MKVKLHKVKGHIKARLATGKRQNWRKTKTKFQKGLCYYCKNTMKKPTLDHVIPLSRGGEDSYENTVACCEICNQEKGNEIL